MEIDYSRSISVESSPIHIESNVNRTGFIGIRDQTPPLKYEPLKMGNDVEIGLHFAVLLTKIFLTF